MKMKKIWILLTALFLLIAYGALAETLVEDGIALTDDALVEYGLDYSQTDEVALYLHAFWELPPNYLTKAEAYDMGWDSRAGNLWAVAPEMSIGGDRFGNREGRLPALSDRQWYECDVNYDGGHRGAERILFSSDGLIYFSADHYETFELLYEVWFGEGGDAFVYGVDALYYDADWNRVFEEKE